MIVEPGILGSHAIVYADAARAWLTGGNPWTVGPPMVVFAGPPPMLLPFAPFAFLPGEVTRYAWVALDLALAVWVLRRLSLPFYWIAFPPLFEAIVLGHPEVLVLGLLVLGGSVLSGLAPIVKVYAGLPLLAERRWRSIALAAVVGVATLPVLPWSTFLGELPGISANLARQNVGDSTFGQPVLMAIAILALAALGPRRALWVAVPVLWPYAQPIYKVMSLPVLPPLVALAWAIPVPGLTLVGLVAWAALVTLARRRALPAWLRAGIEPAGSLPEAPQVAVDRPSPAPAVARLG